ncbi:MAG: hypothetical protein JWM16_6329 [Verrucomicrobiales bacterium]|nr:hypothetical protein [Verrucomicrobiales bacterium]
MTLSLDHEEPRSYGKPIEEVARALAGYSVGRSDDFSWEVWRNEAEAALTALKSHGWLDLSCLKAMDEERGMEK